ncbi:MAG: response regulator [Actinomycetota bacterium]|nr:response regulator [Actinomycetota bacterium]
MSSTVTPMETFRGEPHRTEGHRRAGQPAREVLLVEDDWAVVKFVNAHLAGEGYDVMAAGNVGEAWRIIQADPPDVAIIDVRLPGVYGWELIERIRKDSRFHKMPILVVSADFDKADLDKISSLGCQHLVKPITATDLITHVKGLFEESQRVDLVSVKAILLTKSFKIEGTVHVSPEITRFSDAMEMVVGDNRAMLPVTNATITTLTGEPVGQPGFVQIMKSEITAVFPADTSSRKNTVKGSDV